ncbi:hypothetical protein DRQ07_12060 [candidate division KSB1 bacterium]|nr:MAG: hypothetical protein DRQ07_12060 [candidate division KSB1 bacterium]
MIKIIKDEIKILLSCNKILGRRIKATPFVSELINIMLILVPSAMTLYFIISNMRTENPHIDSDIIYILIISYLMNLMFILLQYSTDTMVTFEPLIIMPYSKKRLYSYLIAVIFINKRVLIYFIPMFLLFVRLLNFNVLHAFLSFILLISYFLVADLYCLNIYLKFSKQINRIKSNVSAIPSLILIFLILSDRIIGYENMSSIPYLGQAGKVVASVVSGDSESYILLFFLNSLLLIIGIIIGKNLVMRKQYI